MSSLNNIFPSVASEFRLAVVAECPSKDDALKGESFESNTGRFIKGLLSSVGAMPQACFLGYIYDKPAPWGRISFIKDKSVMEDSLTRLIDDLASFRPNCVLLLGDGALKLFGGTHSIDNFRGSIFRSPTYGFKCVASYSPLHCFQKYIDTSLLKFDMHRALQESYTSDLNLPERHLEIADNIGTAFNYLNQIASERQLLGFDVEGYPDNCGITCFSFAASPSHACVIPLRRFNGTSVFSVPDEVQVWRKLCEILENPDIAIICQNAMYELFMMSYKHRIVISNVRDDTMIKHWELYPEFPKNLGIQTSLYTREPYFKDGRQATTDIGHWEYNAKDSAILIDINDTQKKLLAKVPAAAQSYEFKMQLLKPYTYMSVKGCRIHLGRLTEHRKKLFEDIVRHQNQLNALVGKPINAKSHVDKKWLLYEFMGFDKCYAGRGESARLTADEETILKCKQKCLNPVWEEILSVLLSLIKARTDFSDTFKLEPFEDGRIRCSYNPVGTETGRLSSSSTSVRDNVTKPKLVMSKDGGIGMKAVTKVAFRGTNLQNVSKWLRDVFIPDPGYLFWQYDLSGADAWTVAADLYALGYGAMLEHLSAGVKPSCVILMMRKYGTEIINWDTDKILSVQPEMKNAGKMYVCAKACQHGCVTAGHEVLTQQGWVAIENLDEGIPIMAWNKSGLIWETPTEYIEYPYSGDLYHYKGNAYDLEITADHRMPYETNNNLKVLPASKLSKYSSAKLPVSSHKYVGHTMSELNIRLLAAFHSDGCIHKTRKKICFHLRKQRKIDRLKQLLIDAGIPHREYFNTDNTRVFEFNHSGLIKVGKNLGPWVYQLETKTIATYLEETLLWDGSLQEEYCHKRQEITTANKQRAEYLHTMAYLCGKGSVLNYDSRVSGFGTSIHSVSINNRAYANLGSMEVTRKKVTEKMVYCVTVPSSYFLVRRNNKIMITGNSNYGMGAQLLADTIFKRSNGEINIDASVAKSLQQAYENYYRVSHRTRYVTQQLQRNGYIDTASGSRRRFLGIRNNFKIDQTILRAALSHEPQNNTTYATNLALHTLYYNSDNRRGDNLIVQPLLMIHDALAGQVHANDAERMLPFLKKAFTVTMNIHGIDITIPAEGGYGENWKQID